MPRLSRSQTLVYAALGVTLLLIGARWVRTGSEQGSPPGDAAFAAGQDEERRLSVDASEGEDVVVHVAGAVREPGVYRLPAGSRVTDAVERAGGPAAGAFVESINLAARLADGQQIQVPARANGPVGVGTGTGLDVAESGPISLGTATVEQLDTIEGIGPVTAQNIIAFRDERGGLSSIEELDEVSGIGPATMEALRNRLQP